MHGETNKREKRARTLVNVEKGADAVAGAVAVVEAGLPQRHASQHVEFATCSASVELLGGRSRGPGVPVVPRGKTAVSRAMWPCSTRVKAAFSCAVGVPKCIVRVTSVVPSLRAVIAR